MQQLVMGAPVLQGQVQIAHFLIEPAKIEVSLGKIRAKGDRLVQCRTRLYLAQLLQLRHTAGPGSFARVVNQVQIAFAKDEIGARVFRIGRQGPAGWRTAR